MADLEAAALSGDLFRPRSPSPTRSASTASPVNTDDELGSDLSDSPPHSPSVNASQANLLPREGAQTGPKGVIEDRRAENLRVMAERKAVLRRTRLEQKQRAIIAETVEEEAQRREREAREEEDARVRWRRNRREELELERREQNEGGNGVVTKRGGLREVGQGGFVLAVERVGWVVVLIYEPDIPRCQTLLANMLHLSLNLPTSNTLPCPVTLFRARATSLSFSLLPDTSPLYPEEVEEEDEEGPIHNHPAAHRPRGRPDPDVLPTMLAYKDGELERTWIRVDWEVKEDGIEGMLRREGILPPLNRLVLGQGDLPGSDDDD